MEEEEEEEKEKKKEEEEGEGGRKSYLSAVFMSGSLRMTFPAQRRTERPLE